jgi:hypothetical protein
MLYLVGGASRSGKSLLARRLLMRQHIPYFSIDILMMGLFNGYPAFGLDTEASGIVLGEMLWPILRAMAVNILEEKLYHPTYLLEGVELLPKHVAELIQTYPGQIRACFIGYTRLEPAAKLPVVRQHEKDWGNYYTDEEALAFLAGEVEFSRYLQHECAAYNLRYFDCSEDIMGTVEEAMQYLMSP